MLTSASASCLLTSFASLQDGAIDGPGFLVTRGMDASLAGLGLARVSTQSSSSESIPGRLNGHGLSHNGAAMGVDLQLRHGTTAGRGPGASRGRQGSQRGGRSSLQERAHGFGLTKNAVHGDSVRGKWKTKIFERAPIRERESGRKVEIMLSGGTTLERQISGAQCESHQASTVSSSESRVGWLMVSMTWLSAALQSLCK